jgi:Chaperone for flagella basal body P-ring formation
MKCFRIAASVASVLIFPAAVFGQQPCRITVEANVEVAGGAFSLADVLTRDTCPGWRRAAERVRMGGAPLAGSARVIEGEEVRALLEKVAASNEAGLMESANASVPERITVRRAGRAPSCADLGRRILATLPPSPRPRQVDCTAAPWLPRDTPFELSRKLWNPALASWELIARCVDPKDCAPFLLRLPGGDLPRDTPQSGRSLESRAATSPVLAVDSAAAALPLLSSKPLVRRGEGVSLLWEQDGIRLVVRAVSLDAGGAGEEVRVRIGHGGRTLRAVVVAAGTLRATS